MTGRNALCPCGSGKKYKRCHLDLDAAAAVNDQPSIYFGFDSTRPADASPIDLETDGMVCMVRRIDREGFDSFRSQGDQRFAFGDWMVSTGHHGYGAVDGPFRTENAAFDFARSKMGAVRFLTGPETVWPR